MVCRDRVSIAEEDAKSAGHCLGVARVELDMVVLADNHSTQEAEAGRVSVRGQPGVRISQRAKPTVLFTPHICPLRMLRWFRGIRAPSRQE